MTSLIQLTHLRAPNDGSGDQSGQYTPTDITPGNDNQNTPQVPDAIQKRFDEMTAQIHESQRLYQESQNQNMALIAQLARPQVQQQTTAPAAPSIQLPEGTDPAIANAFQAQQKFFQDALAQQARMLQESVNQNMGQMRMTQEQLQFQQVAQKYPPEVQRLGEQRLAEWRKAGLTGWNPEDALRYAYGELASTGKLAPVQGQAQQNQNVRHINQPSGYMPSFGAPPPPVQQTQTLPDALPDAVLNKMKPDAQLKYWEDRLAKTGGVDQPILNVS